MEQPSASEQLELRQNAELLRTDILREQTNVLLETIQASACGSRNSRYCVTLLANELIKLIMGEEEIAGIRTSTSTATRQKPVDKTPLTTTVSIIKSYPFITPAGFDLNTLHPSLLEIPISLSPMGTPTAISPWLHGIHANVPGSTTMYVDINIPIGPINAELFDDSVHFLIKAAYLAGLLHHILIPALKLMDSSVPTRNVANYAKGDAIRTALYDRRLINLGVSYLENSLLHPTLCLYIDATDYLKGLADVQMPISRNLIFRFVPQITCHSDVALRLNTLHSRRFAIPFSYGDPREDSVAPPFALINQTTLCIDYEDLVDQACAALTTPTLHQVAILLYLFLVLHGAAPRTHLDPRTVEALDAQQDILYEEESGTGFSISNSFSGTYPSHGLSFLSACAIVSHALRFSDIFQSCTDAATGFRVLLTYISKNSTYLIPQKGPDDISTYLLTPHTDNSAKEVLKLYTPARWAASGTPLLLTITKNGLLYNYLHTITLGMWTHILQIANDAHSLFLDSSLNKSAFQVFSELFPQSNFTSAGSLSIFGCPGHDITLAMRLKGDIFTSSLLPTLFPHLIEGVIHKAFVEYTTKITNVACVTHWGAHTNCSYRNNLLFISPNDLRACFTQKTDALLPQPLYIESQPHMLVLCKLAPSALNQLGAAIHRGPSIISQEADASLYSHLFGFSVKKEKILDKRRFADGDTCVCTKWARGVSVEEQLHRVMKEFVRHNLESLIEKVYIRDSIELLDAISPEVPQSILITEAQVLNTACEHIQAALQAASIDCTELPVNVISISMNDEYGRLTAVDSPAYILYLNEEASEDQIPFNNRCITGMLTLQNRDAWPKDPGAIACLKLLVLSTLMNHIQTRKPSLHSSAVLKAADVGYKTNVEAYLVDNVAYTSYIPSDSKLYLRGSCLDIFMPIRHIDKKIYGKEMPDFVENSAAGGYRGVAFRFFIALPQDQSYYTGNLLRTYRIKEQYYNTIHNLLPAHAAAIRSIAQQNTAYYFTVLLAKRWVTAHLIPMYTLTHLFIDSAANPVTSRIVVNLYKQYVAKEITREEFFELLRANDEELFDSEDEDMPPRLVKSAFTQAREEVTPSHTLVAPSARAYMGYISHEAIELMVAYVFTQHTKENRTVIASPIVGFRLFLVFLIECWSGLSPMEKEYDTFAFMRQWYYEGVSDPEYSTYCSSKQAADSADSYSNFIMDIYRETMPGRRQHGRYNWKTMESDKPSARNKQAANRKNYVAVTDVVVDPNVALGQEPLSNKDYELLYNTGDRILAKNSKLYSSNEDTHIMYSSGVREKNSDAMMSAVIPPILLRTTYDPSGSLFTASIDWALLQRLGSYALLALRALDTHLAAECPTIRMQALFSTSIDHINAVIEIDDLMHATVRCDGQDREFAPVPSSVLQSKNPTPREWSSCTLDNGFGCEDLLLFDSLRASLAAPPIGYDPLPLCLPIISRTLGKYARIHVDTQAATKVGIQLHLPSTHHEKLEASAIEREQLLYRLPDTSGGYIFSKELFLEQSLTEAGRLFKRAILTDDIVPPPADETPIPSRKNKRAIKP